MLVRQGHWYYGGASIPPLVSHGMVAAAAHANGFDSVQVWDREDINLPFAPPSDDYDTVALARRAGPDTEITVPSEVAWVYDANQPAAPPVVPGPDAPAVTPPPNTVESPAAGALSRGLVWLGGAVAIAAAAGVVWIARRGG